MPNFQFPSHPISWYPVWEVWSFLFLTLFVSYISYAVVSSTAVKDCWIGAHLHTSLSYLNLLAYCYFGPSKNDLGSVELSLLFLVEEYVFCMYCDLRTIFRFVVLLTSPLYHLFTHSELPTQQGDMQCDEMLVGSSYTQRLDNAISLRIFIYMRCLTGSQSTQF